MTLFPGSLYGGVGQLGAAAKAASPWWLAGGISAANCVAAYQPKGAADLAASYINLANPGTYNAAPGTAPTWDAVNGWIFNGLTQYLATGISPVANQTWSMIVRYANAAWSSREWECFVGSYGVSPVRGFILSARDYVDSRISVHTGSEAYNDKNNVDLAGTMCLAGTGVYKNGTPVGTIANGTVATAHLPLYIGGLNLDGSLAQKYGGNVQAFAIYNTPLSAAQVAALTTAMQAL